MSYKNIAISAAIFICAILYGHFAFSQSRPRLVVGITVDQMRWDYLTRYQHRYLPDGGFKRMMQQGYNCNNAYITYTPTYTAAGHAGIYTGSVPAIHGIAGNEWWDVQTQQVMYCTQDNTVKGVGTAGKAGNMSPANLLTTTICDELRLATNFRSKTIGIAIKDRGGILATGHSATAAYWYDASVGEWITSTYFMNELPAWVKGFNTKKKIDSLYQLGWQTMYPAETYTQSVASRKAYELRTFGTGPRQFPYELAAYAGVNYGFISATPHGNTLTTEFGKAAILGEQLGKDSITDFLAISYSSTDYVGHSFGPNSVEMEDTYIRLDKELGDFFNFLDAQVGKGEYLVFLSSDHGAAHVPGFMKENKMPAGFLDEGKLTEELNGKLKQQFGRDEMVMGIINHQVILNQTLIAANSRIKVSDVQEWLIPLLESQPEISRAFALNALETTTLQSTIKEMVTNGYYPQRSGHIQIILKPGYLDGFLTGGTTHGIWNPYDSHIPLLWYGWQIPKGKTSRRVSMADIAPTLAALLQIQEPNGSIGHVIEEIVK